MEHLPQLVVDLALLLSVAAVATIACRWLKQPLVLGYVVAGILISPAIGWLPNVGDADNISTWADIGVMFLMFGLGLEFSLVKLATVGRPAAVTALTEMSLMVIVGITCGFLFGWPTYTCLFLGGMLAISSTAIISKTFEELGLKGKKFVDLVFGALVVEDIVAIFLMILLSTISASSTIDSAGIALHIGTMLLYLTMWFVLSIIFIPTLFKRVSRMLNDEILLVASIALCLCMVLLANAIGFSTALGAFIAGSILAGTMQGHRIEKLFRPVKNLFGAIFFVSVGMLVSFQAVLENIVPIVVITLAIIIAKPLFTFIGSLISGQSLKTAAKCGVSLSQIGEFSFIIAGLGVSLGVTEGFLYPVIISVSVITTLTTPILVRNAENVQKAVERILPPSLIERIETRAERTQGDSSESETILSRFMKTQSLKTVMLVVVTLASVSLFKFLETAVVGFVDTFMFNVSMTSVALLLTGICISNLFVQESIGSMAMIWKKDEEARGPILAGLVAGVVCSVGSVAYIFDRLGEPGTLWLIAPLLLLTALLSHSRWLHMKFLRFESHFLANLNEGILFERQGGKPKEIRLLDVERQLSVVEIEVTEQDEEQRGRKLSRLFSTTHARHLDLIAIFRGNEGAKDGLKASSFARKAFRHEREAYDLSEIEHGDILVFMGSEENIDAFIDETRDFGTSLENRWESLTLNEYLSKARRESIDLTAFCMKISRSSPMRNKTVGDLNSDQTNDCTVLGIERKFLPIVKPSRSFQLVQGDIVWLVGDHQAKADLSCAERKPEQEQERASELTPMPS